MMLLNKQDIKQEIGDWLTDKAPAIALLISSLFAVFVIMMVVSCSTTRKYTDIETALATCGVVAGGLDMITTDKLLDQGGYERNPILGSHPNDEALYMAYGTGLLIKFGLSELWPDLRPWLWGGSCVVSTAMTINNVGEINK